MTKALQHYWVTIIRTSLLDNRRFVRIILYSIDATNIVSFFYIFQFFIIYIFLVALFLTLNLCFGAFFLLFIPFVIHFWHWRKSTICTTMVYVRAVKIKWLLDGLVDWLLAVRTPICLYVRRCACVYWEWVPHTAFCCAWRGDCRTKTFFFVIFGCSTVCPCTECGCRWNVKGTAMWYAI